MPIFEYLCKECGQSFEKIVPRYDTSVDCAHCNSSNIEKQLSVFAVVGPSTRETSDAGCGRCGAPQPGMCGMMD